MHFVYGECVPAEVRWKASVVNSWPIEAGIDIPVQKIGEIVRLDIMD